MVAVAWVLSTSTVEARVESTLGYTKAQAYSGALRYLRVDLGYEVTERDAEAAYLLFRYVPTGGREPTRGAIEVIEVDREIKLVVQLPEMPTYHEAVLRDGLLRKLREEYGDPPPPKPDDGDSKDPPPGDGDGEADRDEEPPKGDAPPAPAPGRPARPGKAKPPRSVRRGKG